MAEGRITEAAVREVLDEFQDPETGRRIGSSKQVHRLKLDGDKLSIVLGLTTWAAAVRDDVRAELIGLLRERFPGLDVDVELAVHQRKPQPLGEVGLAAKSVIAVASGKGGVGKSSLATLLAFALCETGSKVGLMDADIYGPSVPHLIGPQELPESGEDKARPVEVDGLKVISIGFFIPEDQAVIWRGPMLHGALTQFFRDVDWGELDYLVIDMPPGTGDVALSISQLVPLSGAVVVSTPQDVALLDVSKAITMFRRVEIDVLGMIENMSFFVCSECDARHDIFGSGGAKQKAAELNVPFLGEMPLDAQLRSLGDEGNLRAALDRPSARPYLTEICQNLVKQLVAINRRKPRTPTLPVIGQ